MFENIGHFFKKIVKTEPQKELGSKGAAKERLHLVLMQDRANVSADFLELMKQEIIDVIKKYIVVDEDAIDVRLTNQTNEDGTNGAPSLYANIPIVNIKNDMMAEKIKDFAGVDFNKEMGITPNAREVNNEQAVSKTEVREIDKNNSSQINGNELEDDKESDEPVEIFEEVDEEDDDVTFDDLLKAAEAADKLEKSKKEKKSEEDDTEEKRKKKK